MDVEGLAEPNVSLGIFLFRGGYLEGVFATFPNIEAIKMKRQESRGVEWEE